jgi:hypothetical protein
MKVMERTENGITAHVTMTEGLREINTAMMEGKRQVRTMSCAGTHATIEYKDGRKVTMRRVEINEADFIAPAPPIKDGPKIVTVKGKRYVVGTIVPAQTDRKKIGENSYSLPHPAYVAYWSERNGKSFGATRHASANNKPGTIGRAIWDAVSN